jgi:catechol 2,3-dioxygenase-like lactoylglutathione lyase family enzyme
MEEYPHTLVAIVPCNDIAASTAFYERLGLTVLSDHGTYRILGDGKGWLLHLSAESPKGWVVPGRNPNGLYLYTADVEELATRAGDAVLGRGPEHKPWGMYEFALSDPDGTLVRIGWPSELLANGHRPD